MKTQPNDLAYPIETKAHGPQFGLTKRELFAAMAMQALIQSDTEIRYRYLEVSDCATAHADTLIQTLNRI